jgi:hypothetical protein
MNALFINSTDKQCGVHQYGLALWRVLKTSQKVHFHYLEPKSLEEVLAAQHPDVILWNFHPVVFPWVTLRTLVALRDRGIRQVALHHEARITGFDAYIDTDPSFSGPDQHLNQWFSVGRPLPPVLSEEQPKNEIPVISSAGFGFARKGHQHLAQLVTKQFERAVLRLHLPFATFGDPIGEQAWHTEKCCRDIVAQNPGIELQVTHHFMEPEQLVEWLGQSDLNAYLYSADCGSSGVASATDPALAARRPIAITRNSMFRHLDQCEGIRVEESTLPEIIARGLEPLRSIYDQYHDDAVRGRVEEIFFALSSERFNRLLTNVDRENMCSVVEAMHVVIPEMLSRKIPEANVQQAWVLDTVLKARPKSVLSVGCFEDTAFETLKALYPDMEVVGIDPALNMDLETFRQQKHTFDVVFAVSVLEHVQNDEAFIASMCACLNVDGVGVLTCDFNESWRSGQPVPATDVRLYTSADIRRLETVLIANGCYLVDVPDFSGEPDFWYQGHNYSFFAMTFRKL